jgi:hypothetical protein
LVIGFNLIVFTVKLNPIKFINWNNKMLSRFSNTTKILVISLFIGIIIASIVNFMSDKNTFESGISSKRAKELGFKNEKEYNQANHDIGEVFDRARGDKFQLTQQGANTLISYAKTGSEGTQNLSLMILGKLASETKVLPAGVRETFAEASKSPSSKVRLGIVMGLRGTSDPKLRQIFTSLQNDPDPEVSAEVTNFLKEEQINKGK